MYLHNVLELLDKLENNEVEKISSQIELVVYVKHKEVYVKQLQMFYHTKSLRNI